MFIKGFPLFDYFYTVYTPIFAELVGQSLFTRHSRMWPLKSMQLEGWSASGPMFIRGFPLIAHFYTVYTPNFAELLGPSFFTRHSRVRPLKSMQPEERSASGPMFIRGFPLFVHFYTVYTPIFAELVGPSYFTRHSRMWPLKSMQPEGRSASGPMFIRVFLYSITFTLSAPPFLHLWSAQHFQSALWNEEGRSVSDPMFIRGCPLLEFSL